MNDREKEYSKEEAAREQFVVGQFERAGLNIREYLELLERFKRLHNPPESKHFEDAAQMVDIIETIWDQLEKRMPKLDKEQMILATLLHDVGKSGPKEATPEEQELIITLFDPRHYKKISEVGKDVRDLTVHQALQESDIKDDAQKIEDYLKNLGVDINSETMIKFWQRHADWTYDILKASKDGKINERLAAMAASHHILDGKNPARLDPEDIPQESKTIETIETYEVLTLVDKFQAFVKRSGLSHPEAIRVLRGIIDRQKMPERVKNDYRMILEVIETSGEKIIAKMKS